MTNQQRGTTVTGALTARNQPGNQVATTQNQEIRKFVAKMEVALAEQLPKHIPSEYFVRACVTMLRDNEALAKIAATPAGRASIYVGLLEAARFGLMPGTEECALVPFGKTATLIPQAQGLVKMMHNTGKIAGVHNRFIHQHDDWSLTYGKGGGFTHTPFYRHPDGTLTTAEERGGPVLAYCFLELTDGSLTPPTIITREDAEFTRDNYSKGYKRAEESGKKNSGWHTNFDAMWLKTAVRRHSKYAPKSPLLVELLAAAARDDIDQPDSARPPVAADFGVPDLEGEVLSDTGPVQDDLDTLSNQVFGTLREMGVTRDADRGAVCRMLGREMPDDDPLPKDRNFSADELRRVAEKLALIKAGEDDVKKLRSGLLSLARAARGETVGDARETAASS